MDLNKLKEVCDKAVGLESLVEERQVPIEVDAEEWPIEYKDQTTLVYKTGTIEFLTLPISESPVVGWHLDGKCIFPDELDLYEQLHKKYKSARLTEVCEIQRKRGILSETPAQNELEDRVKKLEGALSIAKEWMGVTCIDEDVENSLLQNDKDFVEEVLQNCPVPPAEKKAACLNTGSVSTWDFSEALEGSLKDKIEE